MVSIERQWAAISADLARGGIDLARQPLFLILGAPDGPAGAQLRQQLPRVPNKPIEAYAADGPLQVYGDREAAFLTWSGTAVADLERLGQAMRASRPECGLNGVALFVPFADLATDAAARAAGDRVRDQLAALRAALEVHVPVFVAVTGVSAAGGAAMPPLRAFVPLDLWKQPGGGLAQTAVGDIPRLIQEAVRELLDGRFPSVAQQAAPPPPRRLGPAASVNSSLQPQQDWFNWAASVQGARDRLAFILRMAAIGAGGVDAQLPNPTAVLPDHHFVSARGPVLLGGFSLGTDVGPAWEAMRQDLTANQAAATWTADAKVTDQRRLGRAKAITWGSLVAGVAAVALTGGVGWRTADRVQHYRKSMAAAGAAAQERKYDDAKAAVAAALARFPRDPKALALQADITQRAELQAEFDKRMAAAAKASGARRYPEAVAEMDEELKSLGDALTARPGDDDIKDKKAAAEKQREFARLMDRAQKAWADRNAAETTAAVAGALKLVPDDPNALALQKDAGQNAEYGRQMAAAKAAQAAKQYDAALAAVTAALKAAPDDRDATELKAALEKERAYAAALAQAQAALDAKKYDDAARLVGEALKLVPDEPAGLALQKAIAQAGEYERQMKAGRDAFAAMKYDDALKALDLALAARPGDKDATDLLARIDTLTKNARGEYIRQTRAAQAAFEARKYDDGLKALDGAAKALEVANPNDPDTQTKRAEVEKQQNFGKLMAQAVAGLAGKKYDDAGTAVAGALKLLPEDAVALAVQKEIVQAADARKSYDAQMKAAAAAYQGKKYDDALKALDAALVAVPADKDATDLRTKVAQERKQKLDDAMAAANTALRGKKYDEALKAADAALAVAPDDKDAADLKARIGETQKKEYDKRMAAARTARDAKQYADALKSIDEALAVRPEDEDATTLRGQIADDQKKAKLEYDRQMAVARAALENKQYDDALAAAAAALAAVPNDSDATELQAKAEGQSKDRKGLYARQMKLAQTALDGKRYDDAQKAIDAALTALPNDKDAAALADQVTAARKRDYAAQLSAARQALDDKKYDDALRAADAALALMRDDRDATDLKTQIGQSRRREFDRQMKRANDAFAEKLYDDALAAIDAALAVTPGADAALDLQARVTRDRRQSKQDFDTQMAAANRALRNKRYDEAQRAVAAALAANPNNQTAKDLQASIRTAVRQEYQAQMSAAQAALTAKQYDGALKAVNLALAAQPRDQPAADLKDQIETARKNATTTYDARMADANVALAERRFADATKAVEAALAASPGDRAALALQTRVETAKDQEYRDQLTTAARALAATPKNYADALKAYDAALAVRPSDRAAATGRAAAVQRQKFDKAMADATAAMARNNLTAADAAVAAALQLVPNDPAALALRDQITAARKPGGKGYDDQMGAAQLALTGGRFVDALTAVNKALDAKPNDGQATALKGRILMAQGKNLATQQRFAEAAKAYQAALDLKPNDPAALMGRCNAEAKLFQYAQAWTTYWTAMKTTPPAADVRAKQFFCQNVADGHSQMMQGNYLQAARSFSAALTAVRGDKYCTEMYNGCTAAAARPRDRNRARIAFEAAKKLCPSEEAVKALNDL